MRKTSDKKLEAGYIDSKKIEPFRKQYQEVKPEAKTMKLVEDSRGQLLVRFPQKIAKIMELTKNDFVVFELIMPQIGSKEKPILKMVLKRE